LKIKKIKMAHQRNSERDKKIVEECLGGAPMVSLAKRHGLTRQRIEQIVKNSGVTVPKRQRSVLMFSHTCNNCEKVFESTQSNRKYCCVECGHLGRRVYKTEEERRKRDEEKRRKYAQRSLHYYHNVFKKKPNWRQIVKERNDRYAAAQKKNT